MKTPIKHHRAVLDIETGGFSCNAGIVEVALIVFDENYQPVHIYSSIVQPYFHEGTEELVPYTRKAQEIHGIYLHHQEKHGKPPHQVAREIEDVLQVYAVNCFVGHNIEKFDLPRMTAFFERFSTYKHLKPFEETDSIDTMIESKKCLNLDSYSLGSCCDYFGIENQDEHRAASDCMANLKLLECLEN